MDLEEEKGDMGGKKGEELSSARDFPFRDLCTIQMEEGDGFPRATMALRCNATNRSRMTREKTWIGGL